MATMVPPQKNVEYIFYVSLISQADVKLFQNDPTLAAGDVLVSTDGGATSNLDTLPAVTPASSDIVKVTVSATEMNGDNIIIVFSDAAGSEWCDLMINIQTAAQSLDAMDTNIDDIETDTAVIGALGVGLTAIPWNSNWDAEVQSECADALTAYDPPTKAEMDTGHGLLATPAEVNAEVVDALGTDTLAELAQAIPAATPTIKAAIMLLYMIARNKLTTTSTELGIYNDAGTKIAKKALADDGSTYTEDEAISGA